MMANFTRRQSLGLIAVASIPPTAVVAVAAVSPADDKQPNDLAENPVLVEAYKRFLAARSEFDAATDALEWLGDEWRHLWPLAPEEILNCANADRGPGIRDTAERDLLGRYIYRDTSELTKRFDHKKRNEASPRLCFSIYEPELLEETISSWERPRTGRTPKALARNIAFQQKVLTEYREKLRLCNDYHAEVKRIRDASGVERFEQRIHVAEAQVRQAAHAMSSAHAKTPSGLRMKAEAMKQDAFFQAFAKQGGLLGDMARFVFEALAVVGEGV